MIIICLVVCFVQLIFKIFSTYNITKVFDLLVFFKSVCSDIIIMIFQIMYGRTLKFAF